MTDSRHLADITITIGQQHHQQQQGSKKVSQDEEAGSVINGRGEEGGAGELVQRLAELSEIVPDIPGLEEKAAALLVRPCKGHNYTHLLIAETKKLRRKC